MTRQKYMVVVDGEPCAVGLAWGEALVEASKLLAILALPECEPGVVTISELELAEPLATWRRVGSSWDFTSAPVWRAEAA